MNNTASNNNRENQAKGTENVRINNSNNSDNKGVAKSLRGFALDDELKLRIEREATGISPAIDNFIELLGTLRNGLERKSQEYFYKYEGTAINLDGIDEIDTLVHDGCEALTEAITRLAGINIAAKTMYNSPC